MKKIKNKTLSPVQCWQVRSELKGAIRSFFRQRDSLEIDTPIAVLMPGTEVHLDYFPTTWTDYNAQNHALWLRSSPELHMKQALAAGAARVFQLAPCFRNGGEYSAWHHPEFTMLEWYELGLSFEAMIAQTEELVSWCQEALAPRRHDWGLRLRPGGLPQHFARLSVQEAFREFAGLELWDGDPDLAKKARAQGVLSVQPDEDFETAFFKILLEKVEPALERMVAVILYDYPPSQAALARVEEGQAKRFEFYLWGVELCNGFYELLGESDNRLRIQEANRQRQHLGKSLCEEDPFFYDALRQGIPPASGNALGFDRCLALLLGLDGLEPIIPFRGQGFFAP